ncbi:Hypothetical predicted protein [Marmota monax]|uniref:Uncharacterized protein n=1 Tax=Marmota monax TaxID=9995 RepID=A0A5E4AX05_MARMO|nr:hypothetical protein GHT09_010469 [Marmota monax]VTJ61958.1 Hypothetical predicted protein [Marmota monax]
MSRFSPSRGGPNPRTSPHTPARLGMGPATSTTGTRARVRGSPAQSEAALPSIRGQQLAVTGPATRAGTQAVRSPCYLALRLFLRLLEGEKTISQSVRFRCSLREAEGLIPIQTARDPLSHFRSRPNSPSILLVTVRRCAPISFRSFGLPPLIGSFG